MSVRYVVGFSGGIDSQACALWVRERFPAAEIILLNSDVGGHEHPVTSEFIRWYSEHVFPVTVVTPLIRDLGTRGTMPGTATYERRHEFADDDTLTFDRMAYIKQGFPSRRRQFCTEHLKLAPQRRWCEETIVAQGIDFERYTGVRRDESENRKGTAERTWDDYFDCYINSPLATWTKQQCFDYVRSRGEQVNPLYTMGFGRVGCAPCVNSGKEDIREWAMRFPEMIDKVRRWEALVGYTFFPPCIPNRAYDLRLRRWEDEWTVPDSSNELAAAERMVARAYESEDEFELMIEGSNGGCKSPPKMRRKQKRLVRPGAPPPPKRPLNWVDEVVRWAKTSRGGAITQLAVLDDRPVLVCSSKYGLCE